MNRKNLKVLFSIMIVIIILPVFMACSFKDPVVIENRVAISNSYNEFENKYFKDYNFYKCVVDNYNRENSTSYDYDYELSDEELASLKWLLCTYSSKKEEEDWITDATGIEKLTGLTLIDLVGNQFSELDVSNSKNLTTLKIGSNKLTELDVSKNIELTDLSVYDNNLAKLDLSNNKKITNLDVSRNNLTELDLSKNGELIELLIDNNNLTKLDLSNNKKLTHLHIFENKLTDLNLSENTELTGLYISKNNLTSLDISKNVKLTNISAYENSLLELDITNNTLLTELSLSKNNLTSLDVSKNSELTSLDVSYNKLTNLDVSGNYKLKYIRVENNNFQSKQIVYLNKPATIISPFKHLKYLNNGAVITVNQIDWWSVEECTQMNLDKDNKTITLLSSGEHLVYVVYDYTYHTNGTKLSYSVNYTFQVAELTSSKYGVDNNGTIYVPHNETIDENIINNLSTNYGTVEYSDNKVKMKDNDTTISEFAIEKIKLTSSNDNIKILDDNVYFSDINDSSYITSNYGTININNKVEVMDNDIVIDTFDIAYIDFNGYQADSNSLILPNELTYEEFTDNIVVNKVEYKIFDGNEEIISGNIKQDMVVKVYYNDIELTSYTIKIVNVTSESYVVKSDGIYIENNLLDLNKLEVNIGVLRENGNKIEVVYDNKIYKTFEVIRINSDYIIYKDTIYIINEDFNLNNMSINHGTLNYKDNKLSVIFNDTILKTYNINKIELNTNNFVIDKNTIYIKDYYLEKLNDDNHINISDNILQVIIDNNVVKEYSIVKVSLFSDKYELTTDNVISDTKELDLEKLTSSIGNIDYDKDNNLINIKYNEKIISSYKVIFINSLKYGINLTSNYIYTGIEEIKLMDINTNGYVVYIDNNVNLYDQEDGNLLKTFNVYSVDFKDLEVANGVIYLNEKTSYNDFKDMIGLNDDTLKFRVFENIENNNLKEITSGNIETGYIVKIYKDEEEIGLFSINAVYYEFISEDISIDYENNYISHLLDNKKVEEIKKIVKSTGEVQIIDKNGEEKGNDEIVGTGDKIVIYINDATFFTYTLIVKGDVNGDGYVTAKDAKLVLQHSIELIELTDEYFIAGNIDSSNDLVATDAKMILKYSIGSIESW